MGSQRQLNALLFELQTARSPLAQAKILARAWRTVRELSPTDRKLLARHAGFDGAEEILEGLAKKKGGMAPAMLLQMLTNARANDASTLQSLLSAFRDPSRRDEALSRSLDLAADLMRDQEATEGVEEAVYELHADEPVVDEEQSAEAPEVLPAVDEEGENGAAEIGEEAEDAPEISVESSPEPPVTTGETKPESIPKKSTPPPVVVDWSRWDSAGVTSRPAPFPRTPERQEDSRPSSQRVGGVAKGAPVGGKGSTLARLRALHREIADLSGSSLTTLGLLIETFPDGWSRRRALAALIEAGIPQRAEDAVTLIESFLDRELDRRWCLGVLASRGDLRGDAFDRAVELLSSPSARRRLSGRVSQSRSGS